MNSDPPKSGKSWKELNGGPKAKIFGLTVPEFPLSSASPAMTSLVVFGAAGGPSRPMLSVSSEGVYVTRMSSTSNPELKTNGCKAGAMDGCCTLGLLERITVPGDCVAGKSTGTFPVKLTLRSCR